jgi:hypothetical protein
MLSNEWVFAVNRVVVDPAPMIAGSARRNRRSWLRQPVTEKDRS